LPDRIPFAVEKHFLDSWRVGCINNDQAALMADDFLHALTVYLLDAEFDLIWEFLMLKIFLEIEVQ
jgi:hypothetical protein